jgi:hypothetical protein
MLRPVPAFAVEVLDDPHRALRAVERRPPRGLAAQEPPTFTVSRAASYRRESSERSLDDFRLRVGGAGLEPGAGGHARKAKELLDVRSQQPGPT